MRLELVWSASFTDGVIKQFDDPDEQETGEHLFKEVLDRKDNLMQFSLLNLKSHRVYEVDLLNGRIKIHGCEGNDTKPEIEVAGNPKYKYRLIYFRRVTHEMKWRGKNINPGEPTDIQYFLGFQYTNEKDENVRRLLQISKDDEVYFA